MSKCGSGAEIGHLLRALKREGGGHDFSIDRPNRLGWKWPGILLDEAFDYRRLTRRSMEIGIRIPLFLKLADLYDAFGPLIQQAQNLVIDAIDLFPVLGKVSGHSYTPSSQPQEVDTRPSAGVAQAKWEMIQEPFLAMQGDPGPFTNLRDDSPSFLFASQKGVTEDRRFTRRGGRSAF